MTKSLTLSSIDKELKRFGITPESREYVAGQTLLAALEVGANADSIARFIKQPRKTVREISRRLRKNKVWQGSKTCCEWFGKDGGIAFCLDCAVGQGWVKKSER